MVVAVMFDSRRVLSSERSGSIAIWLADDATALQTVTGSYGKSAIVSNIMNFAVSSVSENKLVI